MIRPFHAFLAALSLVSATAPMAQTATSVEYYNATLDHFFTSSLQADIDALDSGRLAGWARTGQAFGATAAAGPGTQSCLPVLHPAGQGRFALLLGCAGRVPGGAGQNGKRSQLRRLLLRKPRRLVHGAARSADRHLPCRHRAGVAPVERARRLQPPLHGQLGGARPDACAGPHARRLRPVRGGHVRTGAGTDRDAGRCIRAIPVRRRLRRRRVVRHRLCRRGGRADARGESGQSGQPRRCLAAGPLVERQRTGPRHRRLAGRRAHLDAGRGRVLPLHRRQRNQRRRLRARERSVGDVRAGRHRLADRARDRPARRARCWSAARPTAAGPGAPRRR